MSLPKRRDFIVELEKETNARGQRALDAVEIPLSRGKEPDLVYEFGFAVGGLMYMAKKISNPRKEPTKAQAMKAAKNAAVKLEKAIEAIRSGKAEALRNLSIGS